MPRLRPPVPGDDGFTLVELLVVITLLGVIGSVVVSGLVSSMRVTQQSQSRLEAVAELQRGAARIGRELRAACPVRAAEAGQARVLVHRDGERFEHRFRIFGGDVRHEVLRDDGGTLTVVQGERILVSNVDPTISRFEYYDAAEAVVSDPDEVRTVRVVLARSLTDQSRPIELETAVHLRNGGSPCD